LLIHDVKLSSSSQVDSAGLDLIGEMARIFGLDKLVRKNKAKQPDILTLQQQLV
jgi:hypothetical protein